MKLIERTNYLSKLIEVSSTPDIKVITGVRRSGKSKLLSAFKNILESNDNNTVIHIDFNDTKYENLSNYSSLESFIEAHFVANKTNYLIIDEIQNCIGFEKAINSLHSKEKYRIYITGSNAFLMSSDLATLFTGRVFEIKIFPFSFAEYKKYFELTNNYPGFDDFIKIGGMAGSYLYSDYNDKKTYVKDIYVASILRDIIQKYKIRNKNLLNKIAMYLIDNVGNITSLRNIANVLTNNKQKINHKTVGQYLEYLCNSFLFYKIQRYDIKGKKYLISSDKYYLSDHFFKYAVLGSKDTDTGRLLENIVAIELLRRGYEVYVGSMGDSEIDFVAIKNGEKTYIQVADDLTNISTFNREINSLLKVKDAYSKVIIARTRSEQYQHEGIKIIDIADWLLS